VESEEKGRQELNQFESYHGFFYILYLGCSDLLVKLAESLAIGYSDDVGHNLFLASLVTLNIGQHVHILKQDEVLPAKAYGLHGLMLIDGFSHAGNDERCERRAASIKRLAFEYETIL